MIILACLAIASAAPAMSATARFAPHLHAESFENHPVAQVQTVMVRQAQAPNQSTMPPGFCCPCLTQAPCEVVIANEVSLPVWLGVQWQQPDGLQSSPPDGPPRI